jgi:hypothetical protein
VPTSSSISGARQAHHFRDGNGLLVLRLLVKLYKLQKVYRRRMKCVVLKACLYLDELKKTGILCEDSFSTIQV